MASVTLKYVDSVGATRSATIGILSIKGFADPDSVMIWPPVINKYADGSIQSQFKGFRRVITIDFGVVESAADREFIRAFLIANTRSVYYYENNVGGEEIIVAHDLTDYENEWKENASQFRNYKITVVEKVIRDSWTSYTPPSTVDIMYIKNKVKIEGTQAAPETFTTNSGKLATSGSGNPFPNISLLSYVVTIITPPYQDAKINQVGSITQSGSNISFQLAVSDAGNASGDGFYYCDIIVGLQEITPA